MDSIDRMLKETVRHIETTRKNLLNLRGIGDKPKGAGRLIKRGKK